MTEAAEFLEKLRPGGPWVLTAIIPDGVTETVTANSAAQVDAFVTAYNGKRNLYYSVNPTKAPMTSKAKKEDIAFIEFVHADLDPRDNETTDAAKDRYLQLLAAHPQKPTALIDSGNGINGLWKLEPIISLESQEQIADIEERNKALALALGGSAGTQNVDRILRLPGTTNLPNKKKLKAGRVACPTRLIEFNGVTHQLSAFAPGDKAKSKSKTKPKDAKPKAETKDKLPKGLLHMLYLTGDKPAGYESRSELVWFFVHTALRAGIDVNKIIEAFLDPKFKGCSIHDHVEEQGGLDYIKRQIEKAANDEGITTDDGKQVIEVKGGEVHMEWRATQRALLANPKCQVFVRKNLVEPLWRLEKDEESGSLVLTAQLVRYNTSRLSDVVAHHAVVFMKFDARSNRMVRINPPKEVINTLLERQDWDFPTVVGIINTPTMRPDGSLLTQPGYDPVTQLWFKSSDDIELPPIPEHPTREQGLAALEVLNSLLDGFPFEGETPENRKSVSRSVALAGMMTTVARGAILVAPIFAVVAPDPRTGKTFLVSLIAVLATGHKPVPTAGSRKQEELEKRIETAALSGRPIIHLNNLPKGMAVESEALSQMSTENKIYIRKLGKHEEGLCDCRGTTIFMNGNNIVVAADLVPRTPICRLNADMEQPGSRKFAFNPIALVQQDRSRYLAAVFTIIRAYLAEGSPEQNIVRVNGYESWSRLVQQPLIWLGMADPMGGIDHSRAMDPTTDELRTLIGVLRKYFAVGQEFTAADCKLLADVQEHLPGTFLHQYKRQDLRDLMTSHNRINPQAFGWLIKRHEDSVLGGWSIKIKKHTKDGNIYRLVGPAQAQAAAQKPAVEDDPEVM